MEGAEERHNAEVEGESTVLFYAECLLVSTLIRIIPGVIRERIVLA